MTVTGRVGVGAKLRAADEAKQSNCVQMLLALAAQAVLPAEWAQLLQQQQAAAGRPAAPAFAQAMQPPQWPFPAQAQLPAQNPMAMMAALMGGAPPMGAQPPAQQASAESPQSLLSALAAMGAPGQQPPAAAGAAAAAWSPEQMLGLLQQAALGPNVAAGAASAAGAAQSAGAAFPQALASAEQFASSVQQAQELFQPQRLLSEAVRAVHELPESVKDQVRTRAEAILEETPPELKTYLKTQMETLLPQLPPKMREAFSSHPEELLQNGFALVANLTDVERDALLATTKNVVTHSMRQALAKPEALVETLHKLVDSLPPEVRAPARPDPRIRPPLRLTPHLPPRAPVHRDDRVGADKDAAAGRGPPHLPPDAARLRTPHRALGERHRGRARAARLPPVVAGGGEPAGRDAGAAGHVLRENGVDS